MTFFPDTGLLLTIQEWAGGKNVCVTQLQTLSTLLLCAPIPPRSDRVTDISLHPEMGNSQLFCKQLSFMILKYLCLAQVSEHCLRSHNQDAAWLWPVGNIKPDLQILGTWTSCLEELINPRQKLQHAARMPSAEYTNRDTLGPFCLLKRWGQSEALEEFYKQLSFPWTGK